jgi:GNAT superfamily N-acetyltransferase
MGLAGHPEESGVVSALPIEFRPARGEDACLAAELIAMSDGELGVALFGLGDPALERQILAGLFRRGGNRYSYQWGEIAEAGGQLAGLLLAVPGASIPRLNLGMAGQLWRLYGWRRTLRFIRRAVTLASFKEVQPGELMVGNLAVLPHYQGRGIARRLLARAEALACQMGLGRMALTVDLGNPRARGIYLSAGYRVDLTFHTGPRQDLLGTAGFERMVKEIEVANSLNGPF